MEVIIRPTKRDAIRLAAQLIGKELKSKPHFVLGLATGATMAGVYDELARQHREEHLDFSRCHTFNLDEYVGLPPDSPYSYHAYMHRHLFSRVNLAPANTHLPDGMAADLKAECAHYEQLIRQVGGVDLQLLGLGRDGHIGFNEPLSALRSRTRAKALTPSTLAANAPYFGGDVAKMPRRAITMGVGTILEAHRCLMLVTGDSKAAILARAVEGPITSMVTASALQLHPHCQVVVDEEAAVNLQGQAYYRWIFENEPEWAPYRADAEV
ncbi:MAG: glucosamine-6-phosphate deaminase [Kiritimatiellaeota bacterium]|nr:glucosamine-6-phosphate deaminase [Kiritimatiellota bacterium]